MTTPAQEKARAKAQEKEIRRQFDVFAGEHVDRLPEWAWIGYYFGYQAALSSPAVVALVEALEIAREYALYASAEPGDLATIDAAIAYLAALTGESQHG